MKKLLLPIALFATSLSIPTYSHADTTEGKPNAEQQENLKEVRERIAELLKISETYSENQRTMLNEIGAMAFQKKVSDTRTELTTNCAMKLNDYYEKEDDILEEKCSEARKRLDEILQDLPKAGAK